VVFCFALSAVKFQKRNTSSSSEIKFQGGFGDFFSAQIPPKEVF